MSAQFDLIIRNALLRGKAEKSFDIGIKDGKITDIQPKLDWQCRPGIGCSGQHGHRGFCQHPPASMQGIHVGDDG